MALDFPSSPAVGQKYPDPAVAGLPQYTWDGTVWGTSGFDPVAYVAKAGDTMTGALTLPGNAASALQAVPKQQLDAYVPKKNYIINSAMMVSQENGSTLATTVNYYCADQWWTSYAQDGVVWSGQVAQVTPAGSPNRLQVWVATADASLAAGQGYWILHNIEGYHVADLMIGTAAAKTVTLRFGCKGPAGTYSVGFRNGAVNRCYVTEFTISAGEANTDVVRTVTVPMDVAGTWAKDVNLGLCVFWCLAGGSTFHGTPNQWNAGNLIATSTQSNFLGTNGNTFYLFDVGLYQGTIAPDYVVPNYEEELVRCQRYFWQDHYPNWIFADAPSVNVGANYLSQTYAHPIMMRVQPTITLPAITTGGLGALTVGGSISSFLISGLSNAAPGVRTVFQYSSGIIKANARL